MAVQFIPPKYNEKSELTLTVESKSAEVVKDFELLPQGGPEAILGPTHRPLVGSGDADACGRAVRR